MLLVAFMIIINIIVIIIIRGQTLKVCRHPIVILPFLLPLLLLPLLARVSISAH